MQALKITPVTQHQQEVMDARKDKEFLVQGIGFGCLPFNLVAVFLLGEHYA
jgi:hypothetical protein